MTSNRILNENNIQFNYNPWAESISRSTNQYPNVERNPNNLINENVFYSQNSPLYKALVHRNQLNKSYNISPLNNSNFKSFYFNNNPNNITSNNASFYSISNQNQQRKNSFHLDFNNSYLDNLSELTDSDSNKFSKLLKSKRINREVAKMIIRNKNCLSLLIEGDLIEYVNDPNDVDGKELLRKWAIYMGNNMIMKFENEKIIYESYWRIGDKYFIFINREFDKRLCTLPIYEILKRARRAFDKRDVLSKKFSSDKNFAMWCRFDLNKTDIDMSTDQYGKDAKEFLLERFLNSLDQAEEKDVKNDDDKADKEKKYNLTFLLCENQKFPKNANI